MSTEKEKNVTKNTLGEKIKNIRDAKEMTLMDLEKLSGVRASTISDIERGRIKSPAFDTVRLVAIALGVSPIYFFDDNASLLTDNEKIVSLLPDTIKEAMLDENFLPYLLMTEKAFKEGIPVDVINIVIDAIKSGKKQ